MQIGGRRGGVEAVRAPGCTVGASRRPSAARTTSGPHPSRGSLDDAHIGVPPLVGWFGIRDVWWWSLEYDDKGWDYRKGLLDGAVGGWLLARVSYALDHTSRSRRTQRISGAVLFDTMAAPPHDDRSVVRPEHGYDDGRIAYGVAKIVEFPINEWWEIDHVNVCARGLPLTDRYFTETDIARAWRYIMIAMQSDARVVIL